MRSIVHVAEISALRRLLDEARAGGRTIGLVPTMGALHAGHSSLVAAAAASNDVVVATIFVNPLQFGPTEDLAAYPRELDADRDLAHEAGAAVLFVPSVAEMYPFGPANVLTSVSVRELTGVLDGASRPGHFDGVATVVAKLFAIAGTCCAYFGEKDFQQLAVVRRMAADLSFPVEVIGCPIVREPHGLAMSSRNAYLTAGERTRAAVLHRALLAGQALVGAGETSGRRIVDAMTGVIAAEPVATLDYAAVVDPHTLRAVDEVGGPVRLLVAARVGRARLIDNLGAVPRT